MEEPVSYEFPGHPVGAMAPRRLLNSNLGPNFSFYNPPSFPLPFQSSPSAPFNFGGIQQQHHQHQPQHHQQHHQPPQQPQHPYQFYIASQPPHLSQPVRLASEPPALHSIPDIRPAKNAVNRIPRDPLIKINQSVSPIQPQAQDLPTAATAIKPGTNTNAGPNPSTAEIDFSTEVDVLMKAIQAKGPSPAATPQMQSLPSLQQLTTPASYPASAYMPSSPRVVMVDEGMSRSGKKRKYTCLLPHCGKSFAQKTHLDIHTRAHTGDKPFICKEPSCGQRFSQLGNLKTHQRRHTGEKPFKCDICHKSFAQRGNVRAHKITHQHAKPFTCLLDDCGKQFTQLGNLKSHQNKFHSSTLRTLTLKFSQMSESDFMTPQDRELWEYFATLYKNSNKGIKGRGKDRRISPSTSTKSDPGVERRRLIDEEKMRRASDGYEEVSTYTNTDSEEEDGGVYYWGRRH